MVIDLKRSIDLRWLLMSGAIFILVWSCSYCVRHNSSSNQLNMPQNLRYWEKCPRGNFYCKGATVRFYPLQIAAKSRGRFHCHFPGHLFSSPFQFALLLQVLNDFFLRRLCSFYDQRFFYCKGASVRFYPLQFAAKSKLSDRNISWLRLIACNGILLQIN